MEVMHFKSQKERLDYLKGGFEKVVLVEVEENKKSHIVAERKTSN